MALKNANAVAALTTNADGLVESQCEEESCLRVLHLMHDVMHLMYDAKMTDSESLLCGQLL